MKHLYSGVLALFAAGCLPVGQPDQVIVDGEASLEFQPEVFALEASLRARRESREAALSDIAAQLATLQETLPQLEGLTHLTIDASAAEITPVQDRKCVEESDYRMQPHCPVSGYFGSIAISVKGSPAQSSGQAFSLLSELGAESVELAGYSLSNLKQAQEDALDSAVKDARTRAEKIADAAGASLVGPIRIQYGEGFPDAGYSDVMYDQAAAQIVVTAQKTVVPQTDLNLDPQPIKDRSKNRRSL